MVAVWVVTWSLSQASLQRADSLATSRALAGSPSAFGHLALLVRSPFAYRKHTNVSESPCCSAKTSSMERDLLKMLVILILQ